MLQRIIFYLKMTSQKWLTVSESQPKLPKYGGGSKDHTPPVDFVLRACVFVHKIIRAKIFRKIYTDNMIISASMALSYALKFRNTGEKHDDATSVVVVSLLEKFLVHVIFRYSLFTLILSIICTVVISESIIYMKKVKKRIEIFFLYIIVFGLNY